MPIPPFRTLINWRLLGLHLLAMFCLVLGLRQWWLIQYADLLRGYEQYGVENYLNREEWRRQFDSAGELMVAMQTWGAKAVLAALVGSCALSWLIVVVRRERRVIPLMLLLVGILLNRLGVYEADWLLAISRFFHWPLRTLSLETRLGVTGAVFVVGGLLLLYSTWPARQPTAAAKARW